MTIAYCSKGLGTEEKGLQEPLGLCSINRPIEVFYAYGIIYQSETTVNGQEGNDHPKDEFPARQGEHGMVPAQLVKKGNAPSFNIRLSVFPVKSARCLRTPFSKTGSQFGLECFFTDAHKCYVKLRILLRFASF